MSIFQISFPLWYNCGQLRQFIGCFKNLFIMKLFCFFSFYSLVTFLFHLNRKSAASIDEPWLIKGFYVDPWNIHQGKTCQCKMVSDGSRTAQLVMRNHDDGEKKGYMYTLMRHVKFEGRNANAFFFFSTSVSPLHGMETHMGPRYHHMTVASWLHQSLVFGGLRTQTNMVNHRG